MATTTARNDWESGTATISQPARYTRVAMWLHWAIAGFIIWNLVSGFLVWDFAEQFFKAHRPFYFLGLISHMSAGMTVLALTIVRIAWRLLHEPPPYSPQMKTWERHASHLVHFLLYAGMLLMPLLGWSILSAHPPAGSPGAQSWHSPVAAPSAAPGVHPSGAPAGPPPAPKIWGIVPLPAIAPIANIGFEPGGVKPQHILHEDFVAWHEVGAYLMLLLLCLHIAGALKHQIIDKEPELQRMGVRMRKSKLS
jgi:cytochrome b561